MTAVLKNRIAGLAALLAAIGVTFALAAPKCNAQTASDASPTQTPNVLTAVLLR